jgi:phosphotransferase system  glucose/maltose/N-acetylglucosamine-specific IIC component
MIFMVVLSRKKEAAETMISAALVAILLRQA